MKPVERDELLIRVDQTIKDSLPRIESHLDKINGRLDKNALDINTITTLQKERNKPSKKSIAGWASGAVAIAVALWRAFYNGG